MNTYERILHLLIEQNSPDAWYSYRTICDEVCPGNEPEFWAALSYLKTNSLIKTKESDQRTLHTCRMMLTPEGMSYFLRKKESEKKTKSDRRFNVWNSTISALVGAAFGSIITKLLS